MKRLPYTTGLVIGLAALCFTLAACTTPAEPKLTVREVQIPIRVACVPADTPKAPAGYADDVQPKGSDRVVDRMKNTAAANEQRKARLATIEPIISACR